MGHAVTSATTGQRPPPGVCLGRETALERAISGSRPGLRGRGGPRNQPA
jgi:hypothetical protein